jgi:hypothetical protein
VHDDRLQVRSGRQVRPENRRAGDVPLTAVAGWPVSRPTPKFAATSDTKKARMGRFSLPSESLVRRLPSASVRSRLRRNSLYCAS